MEEIRIHRTVSDDGTEIASRVHGRGPPLVLVHGALEDGDTCWAALLPFLTDRFTCYAVHARGRGLSGPASDLSPARLVQDVTAVVDSIGEAVDLVGESGGGFIALGAAAHSPAASAVAVYEPIVIEAQDEEIAARFEEVVARVGDMAEEDRLSDAVLAFAEFIGNDDELAELSPSNVEALAPNVPVQVREFEQLLEFHQDPEPGEPSPTDPAELRRITAPVLLLHGSRTSLDTWITRGVRHVADHVADARSREVRGAGHFGPSLDPESVAEELIRFFGEARRAGLLGREREDGG